MDLQWSSQSLQLVLQVLEVPSKLQSWVLVGKQLYLVQVLVDLQEVFLKLSTKLLLFVIEQIRNINLLCGRDRYPSLHCQLQGHNTLQIIHFEKPCLFSEPKSPSKHSSFLRLLTMELFELLCLCIAVVLVLQVQWFYLTYIIRMVQHSCITSTYLCSTSFQVLPK